MINRQKDEKREVVKLFRIIADNMTDDGRLIVKRNEHRIINRIIQEICSNYNYRDAFEAVLTSEGEQGTVHNRLPEIAQLLYKMIDRMEEEWAHLERSREPARDTVRQFRNLGLGGIVATSAGLLAGSALVAPLIVGLYISGMVFLSSSTLDIVDGMKSANTRNVIAGAPRVLKIIEEVQTERMWSTTERFDRLLKEGVS